MIGPRFEVEIRNCFPPAGDTMEVPAPKKGMRPEQWDSVIPPEGQPTELYRRILVVDRGEHWFYLYAHEDVVSSVRWMMK